VKIARTRPIHHLVDARHVRSQQISGVTAATRQERPKAFRRLSGPTSDGLVDLLQLLVRERLRVGVGVRGRLLGGGGGAEQ
jgi:hypothetical protein